MTRTLLAGLLLMMCLPFLAGCGGVDKARVLAEVTTLEKRLTDLRGFVDRNAPVVEQLRALADQTKDPTLRDAADKVAASVAAAQAALPGVQEAIASAKTTVATLEADAAGKVPWYAMLAPLGIVLARLIPGVGPVVAELAWALLASKKQKAQDLLPTPAQA